MNAIKNKTNKVMDMKNCTQIKVSDILDSIQETHDNLATKLNEGNITSDVVDTSTWKPFPLCGENGLFNIVSGKSGTKREQNEGNIPFVSSSGVNNGVTLLCADDGVIYEGNAITINKNGSVGYSFWQKDKFKASSDVACCTPNTDYFKDFVLDRRVAHFITTLIMLKGKNTYSWNDKWNMDDMKKDTISLPVDSNGQPDWDFMRDYVRKIEKISNKHAIELTRKQVKNTTSDVVDTSTWKPFPLCGENGLFIIVCGKSGTKKEQNKGNIPFVSSSGVNNGVTLLCADDGVIYEGNAITINKNGSVGYSFWQKDKFKASSDVVCCTPNTDCYKDFVLDIRIAHFITTLIMIKGKNTYSWNDKWGMEDMKKDTISLPVDANGQPDWDFIRDYMHNIENKCDEYINKCKNQVNNLFQSE